MGDGTRVGDAALVSRDDSEPVVGARLEGVDPGLLVWSFVGVQEWLVLALKVIFRRAQQPTLAI